MPWEAQLLTKTRGNMEMFALHDFDGDGMPELHSASYRKQYPLSLALRTKGEDGAPALTPFVLGAEGGGHGFAFGDVNGDGREDVLTEVGWYERPPGRSFRRALEAPPRDRAAAPELPVRGEGPQRRRPAGHHLRPRPRRGPVLVGAAGAAGRRHHAGRST